MTAPSLQRLGRPRWLPFSPWHLLLMPLALIFVFPLIQMILTSFMPTSDINRFPSRLFPSRFSVDGYLGLFRESHILQWMLNTVIVSTVSIVGHLILCSLAGYGFARLRFPGRTLGFLGI